MLTKDVKVIKKDGTKEEFNVQKVVAAVNKSAYRALIKFSEEELGSFYHPIHIPSMPCVIKIFTKTEPFQALSIV